LSKAGVGVGIVKFKNFFEPVHIVK